MSLFSNLNEESPRVIFERLIKSLKPGEYNFMFMEHSDLITIKASPNNSKSKLAGIEVKKNSKKVKLYTTFCEPGLTSKDLTDEEIIRLTEILSRQPFTP